MDKLHRVNMEEMKMVKASFEQSPMVQMSRQMIHNQLLNNGIKFCQGKCKDASVGEEDDVENRWVPFCADVIDSVMCFGFAVVYMGKCYPTIMHLDQYYLKFEIKKNELDFFVYEKGGVDKLIPNAIVFNNFGFSPTSNGNLTSPMVKVLPRLQFLKRIRETCIRMEMQRSDPRYFSEVKDGGNAQGAREGIDFDFYADANSAETTDDMKFQRNKSAIATLSQQKDLYESYLNAAHAASASATLDHITQLPMGHAVKPTLSNTGRNDLVNIHKLVQEEICATFGVPRSMMFSDSSARTSTDTVGTHQTFMHTLLWWKKRLSVILSETYNSLNAEKIMANIDFNKEGLCVDKLKEKYKVNVYFPVTPFVTNQELRQLYEQGVISWKSYGEYALRNISLPIDDLQPKAPPCDALLFEKPKDPAPAAQPAKSEPGANEKKRKAEKEEKESTPQKKKPKEEKTTSSKNKE